MKWFKRLFKRKKFQGDKLSKYLSCPTHKNLYFYRVPGQYWYFLECCNINYRLYELKEVDEDEVV